MSFLGNGVRVPLVILTILTNILGATTGGSWLALLPTSVRASKANQPATL